MRRLLFVPITVLMLAQAFAQQNPPPPPSPTTTIPTPIQTRPPSASPGVPVSPDSLRDTMVTGRLVMLDGMPPPDMVPVYLDCGVGPASNAATMSDLRGEFRFRFRTSSGPSSYGLPRQITTRCAISVIIPGFEPIRKDLAGLDLRLGGDVGMLVLKSLSQAEGTTVSLNGLKAPESARRELMKAREDVSKEKLDSAKNRLEKAVRIYPEYATAWYELGRLQARQGQPEMAAASYHQAAKTDPKYVNPLIELSLIAAAAQRWPEAEQRSESILKMAPTGMPGVYLVHAIACFNQKKIDQAERSVREGLDQDQANQFPKLMRLLGDILLIKGDKAGAAEAFRNFLERAPQSPDARKVQQQLAELSK